jgi:hypothetical protein
MPLQRRKVVHFEQVPSDLRYPRYILTLECGHQVTRKDRRLRGPPKTVECDKCEIVLDRLSYVEPPGWTQARQVGATHQNLRFLEQEGLVESSAQPSAVVHWRLKGPR